MQATTDSREKQLLERLRDLDSQKRRDFFRRMVEKGLNPAQLPITPMPQGTVYELSYAQQRQWFLWKLQPDNAIYNMPVVLSLQGKLDINALQFAFDDLLVRHQSLRTLFREYDGVLQQCISPGASFLLEFEPIGELSELLIQEKISTYIRQPFDLENGPLLRGQLLQRGVDDHIFVVVLHHIVTDDWSMQIIIDELVSLYNGYCSANPPELEKLAIQYADYAAWQRQWLGSGERQRQLDYWTTKLGKAAHVLNLPLDYPRPVFPGYQGARTNIQLQGELFDKVKQYARAEGVSLFVFLLASFQLLLHRYSGNQEVCVGTPIANRVRPETHKLIGFFVNTQVLKADFSNVKTFNEFLQQVKKTTQEAQMYQDLPFEQLVDAIQPERHTGHSPLFQVMFNHLTEISKGAESQSLSGLKITPLASNNITAEFDLMIDSREYDHGISVSLTYPTVLFDALSIEKMASNWRNLIDGVVTKPFLSCSELPLLDAVDRKMILRDWNNTAVDISHDQCIHTLIETQAAASGEAIAVMGTSLVACESQVVSLDYFTLNSKANQLAHYLRAQGVGPDVLVGIAVERSIDMVVALLAILKAGGAYVPLDPEYPTDRLVYMMENSGIGLLITQSSLREQLLVPDAIEILLLDQPHLWESLPATNLPNTITPANLAYVIYTSGSTGKPKGVAVNHHGVVNFLQSMATQPGIVEADRVLALTSLSFDIAGLEIYLPLTTGASLFMLPALLARDPVEIMNVVGNNSITIIQATPSTWKMLTDVDNQQLLSTCKLLTGGEALSDSLAQELLIRVPEVWNLYGPTETTIWSAAYRLTRSHNKPYVGRPIDNTSIHIVDTVNDPQPVGVFGELLIGGIGLARGYFNRPGLTAERFIPDPFSANGDRLYRTGDLARYRADGVIEYGGRLDHQVKIRGFRIELSEIEVRLHALDFVRDVAVVARDLQGSKQLVAYIVPHDILFVADQEGDVQSNNYQQWRVDIKTALQSVLPDYMVPTHFVLLPAFPLTPNGKLDRKALPAPTANQNQHTHVEPRTNLEKQLASIWQVALGVERVGLNDNFFELGGHSLLAAKVFSEIRKKIQVKLRLQDLMVHQTIAALVSYIRKDLLTIPSCIVPLNSAKANRQPLFCVHPAGGASYPYYPLALQLNDQRPVYGIMSKTFVDPNWIDTSWAGVVDNYLGEIKKIQGQGPYLLLGWSLGGALAQAIASRLEAEGQVVSFLGLVDSGMPKDFYDDSPSRTEPDSAVDQVSVVDELNQLERGNLLILNAFFPEISEDELHKQFIVGRAEKGGDAQLNYVIRWACTKTGKDEEMFRNMLNDIDIGNEVSLGYAIMARFNSLMADFRSNDVSYKVKPFCWWATDGEDNVEEMKQLMKSRIATQGLSTSITLTASHKNIIYTPELLKAVKTILGIYE